MRFPLAAAAAAAAEILADIRKGNKRNGRMHTESEASNSILGLYVRSLYTPMFCKLWKIHAANNVLLMTVWLCGTYRSITYTRFMDKGFSWVRAFCSEFFLVPFTAIVSKYEYILNIITYLNCMSWTILVFFSSTVAGVTVQYISITKWVVLLAN